MWRRGADRGKESEESPHRGAQPKNSHHSPSRNSIIAALKTNCFYVARDLTQTTYPPSRNRIIAGYNESAVWARQHAAMWDGRASAAKRDGAASAYPLGAHGAVVLPLVSRPFAESTSCPVAV